MKWYKITMYKAHVGAGRTFPATAYIYEKDVVQVLDVYKKIRGIKKNLRTKTFPDISQLSIEDSQKLEKRIISEGRIDLDKARKTGYYSEVNYNRRH